MTNFSISSVLNSLYRFGRKAPDQQRHSLTWNTRRRSGALEPTLRRDLSTQRARFVTLRIKSRCANIGYYIQSNSISILVCFSTFIVWIIINVLFWWIVLFRILKLLNGSFIILKLCPILSQNFISTNHYTNPNPLKWDLNSKLNQLK